MLASFLWCSFDYVRTVIYRGSFSIVGDRFVLAIEDLSSDIPSETTNARSSEKSLSNLSGQKAWSVSGMGN